MINSKKSTQMQIRPQKSNCVFTFSWNVDTYSTLIKLPKPGKWEERALIFRPTGANIAFLLENFPAAQWLDGTIKLVNAERARLKEAAAALASKSAIIGKDSYQHRTAPYSHQQRAFIVSRNLPNYALLCEPGTGKTKIVLDTACYLYEKKKITTLIVFSVNGVHRNWIDNEIPFHIPGRCKFVTYRHSANLNKSKVAEFEAAVNSFGKLRIFAFNFDAATTKKGLELAQRAIKSGECLLVIDESTRIKNPDAIKTKKLTTLGKLATYRRILTGTPVTKGPEDLYGQFSFLSKQILGYDTFTSFKNQYCVMTTLSLGGNNLEKITGYRNLDELVKKIEPYSFRVLKSECLDLPEKIYKRWPVELSSEQRRVYEELRKNFIAELKGSTLTAELAMTRILRLQQIVCNWFPQDDGPNVTQAYKNWSSEPLAIDKTNNRLNAMDDILDEVKDLPGKTIIWARFRADLKLIQDHLGSSAVSYHGGIKENDRALAIKRFQGDNAIKYFIGNQQSAGVGLTLTAASSVVYYSNSFDYEHRAQSEDRNHRIGQVNPCIYYDIEVARTVDTKIIKALRAKKDLADLITGDPESFFMEDIK